MTSNAMLTAIPTPEHSSTTTSPPSVAASSQRVLACVRCQSRKVKCNRELPCSNCARAIVECVPGSLAPRQRRRRYPERELLERLRSYEALLRRNTINFVPLHPPTADKASPGDDSRTLDSPEGVRTNTSVKSETVYEAKYRISTHLQLWTTNIYIRNLWQAINQRVQGPEDYADNDYVNDEDNGSASPHDDLRLAVIKKTWDQIVEGNDHLLFFGSSKTNADLSNLHPQPGQIFRLWQIYQENVDPLLKITHTPTLQALVVDAGSDVSNMNPALEALMFSIYCVSAMSLTEEECRTLFGSSRHILLGSYRYACQQALLECGLLRTSDRACLTALYLYLVSVRSETEPSALASMLGTAMRIAQRIGIHNESANAKYSPLEAEMRRRLWWSLVIFDNRVSEMSDFKTTTLNPTWDCHTPLNVNDFDIRQEMKTPPTPHQHPTEALFVVIRSELADFIRNSAAHLDFTNPSLKALAKDTQYYGELDGFERSVEERYFAFCNAENPLHFMTIWTTRYFIAKNRLLEYYSRYSRSSIQQTETQRNAAISHAVHMLECNTELTTSPLTKVYRWLVNFDFPFPAYIHILQDLKKRPLEEQAGRKTWAAMSDNYDAHFQGKELDDSPLFSSPLFQLFSRIVLQAWESREAVLKQLNKPLDMPRIVSDIKDKMMQRTSNAQNSTTTQPNGAEAVDTYDYSMTIPMDFGAHGLLYGIAGQGLASSDPTGYPEMLGQVTTDLDMNQFDWTTMDWNPMRW